MSASKSQFRNDWWLKSLVAIVPGFVLALGLAGLFAWWGPGGIDANNKVQFNMWLIAILWLLIINLVFPLRSGWRALQWIGGLAIVSQGLLYLARTGGAA
ncbi:hypothetical protein [Oceanobacter mangrovi]|uniref:hypothetical protein n=1 Tax=Oceanobacter mangrovi TaxID=2862510 RepID=UPI001C8D5FAA|nr:hypothetical protein [Oceanobacter mangrovi]